MERKIGEIFKYNGEWYQCVGGTCRNCSFYYDTVCKNITTIGSTTIGNCHCSLRTDHKSVIFKKLEKVGESYDDCGTILQRFRIHTNVTNADTKGLELHIYSNNTIGIEIKQNKENMEEYKMYDAKEDIPEFDKVVDECLFGEDKPNLKPFNLEAAKANKPVYTRDGRKARIVCFDRIDARPILALVRSTDGKAEDVFDYFVNGKRLANALESRLDLMMLPERKEGWINIYNADTTFYYVDGRVFETKDEAVQEAKEEVEKEQREKNEYIDTIRVEWEE